MWYNNGKNEKICVKCGKNGEVPGEILENIAYKMKKIRRKIEIMHK